MTALPTELMVEALSKAIPSDLPTPKGEINAEGEEIEIPFISELLAQKLSLSTSEDVHLPENALEVVREALVLQTSDSEAQPLDIDTLENLPVSPELLEQILTKAIDTNSAENPNESEEGYPFDLSSIIEDAPEIDSPATSLPPKNETEATNNQDTDSLLTHMAAIIPPQLKAMSEDAEQGDSLEEQTELPFPPQQRNSTPDQPRITKSEPTPKDTPLDTHDRHAEPTSALLPPEEALQLDQHQMPTDVSRAAEIMREQLPRVEVTPKQVDIQTSPAAALMPESESFEPVNVTTFDTIILPPKPGQEAARPQPVQFAFGHHTNAQGDQHVKIHLLPAELGHIRVDLKVDGVTGEKAVSMIFANPQTYELFKENTQSLQQMLMRAGYDVTPEQITLQHPGEELRENLENFFAQQQQHQQQRNARNANGGAEQDEEELDDPEITNINQLMNVSA